MLRPYREIQKITEPMRRVQEITEPFRRIQKMFEPITQIQESFKNITSIYDSIPKFENPLAEHLETFQRIGERLKEYAEKTPKHLLLIAQHGWFIELDSDFNLPSDVAEEIESGEIESVDQILSEHYLNNRNRIFNELANRHPQRKDIFEQLKNGFENGDFYLTIPTLLAQVDGIAFDFTKKKFFIKDRQNNYLPQVTLELENISENFLNLYLSPLQSQTPIMAREQDITKFPCRLNRHEILHGVNTTYGTQLNCLKVLSLIKYLSDLLIELDKKTLSTTKPISNSALRDATAHS